jgi:hypothetical protein
MIERAFNPLNPARGATPLRGGESGHSPQQIPRRAGWVWF